MNQFNIIIYLYRLLLSLSIILFHFSFIFPEFINESYKLHFGKLYLAVDAFFVLSGYLISNIIYRYSNIQTFITSRLKKLIPYAWFGISLVFSMYLARYILLNLGWIKVAAATSLFVYPNDLFHLVYDLLMLNGLGILDSLSWNYPGWSISTEIFVYLIFSVIYFKKLYRYENILLIGALLFFIFLGSLNVTTRSDGFQVILQPLLRGLLGFILGCKITSSDRKNIIFIIVIILFSSFFNFDLLIYLITFFWIFLSEKLKITCTNNKFTAIAQDLNIAMYVVHAPVLMMMDIISRRFAFDNFYLIVFGSALLILFSICCVLVSNLIFKVPRNV